MTPSLLKTNALVADIKEHFPLRPLPSATDLRSESYATNSFLKDKTWEQVTADAIVKASFDSVESYLTFMNPKGFCYFIPAYMMMSLFENKEKFGWMYSTIFYQLTPKYASSHSFIVTETNRQPADAYFLNRIAPLTAEQKQVVADFLYHQSLYNGTELRLDDLWNEEPRKAFDAYWYQFASQA